WQPKKVVGNDSLSYSNRNELKMLKTDKSEIEANVLSDALLYETLLKVRNGDFSERFPSDRTGISGKFLDTFNEIIELNEQLVKQFTKAGKIIGKEGKLSQRVKLDGGKGDWITCVD